MTKFDAESCLNSIHQTEEAIRRQRAVLASATDAFVGQIARRSLETLEDMLSIQRRTYQMLIGGTGLPCSRWQTDQQRPAEQSWSEQLPPAPASQDSAWHQ